MKKFIYRMENILNIKYQLEEQARLVYVQANSELVRQEEILKNYEDQRAGYEEEIRKIMVDTIDLKKIYELENHIKVMKSRIRTQLIEVHVASKNANSARRKLQQIMVDRKSHETLKDHAFEDYKVETNHEEMKTIDQLVSYRHTIDKDDE